MVLPNSPGPGSRSTWERSQSISGCITSLAIYGAVYHSLGILNAPLYFSLVTIWMVLFLILVFTLLHWSFYGDGVNIPSLRLRKN